MAATKRTPATKKTQPELGPEEKLQTFGKELEKLLAKYEYRMSVTAELVPSTVDGSVLGVKPQLQFVPIRPA
jgi:hypothetical protein